MTEPVRYEHQRCLQCGHQEYSLPILLCPLCFGHTMVNAINQSPKRAGSQAGQPKGLQLTLFGGVEDAY
jgi:ribosomal protein L37E